jgi:oligopeptide/dipeptide ABC transporter ATP-binding protein
VRERQRERIVLPPATGTVAGGCLFRARCWAAEERCAAEAPVLEERGQGHPVACHFAGVAAPT